MLLDRLKAEVPFQLFIQILAVVAVGGASYVVTHSNKIVLAQLGAGVGLLALGYWTGQRHLKQQLTSLGISRIVAYNSARPPIERVPVNTRISDIERRFLFMGVSAKVLWDSNLFAMMANPEYSRCEFRFLLLDPARGALLRRMRDEGQGGSPAAAKNDVKALMNHLAHIHAIAPQANIACRLYDLYPSYWLMLCDDILYVQTFPKNTIGRYSPLLILDSRAGGHGSLFEAIVSQIEDIWQNQSKPGF